MAVPGEVGDAVTTPGTRDAATVSATAVDRIDVATGKGKAEPPKCRVVCWCVAPSMSRFVPWYGFWWPASARDGDGSPPGGDGDGSGVASAPDGGDGGPPSPAGAASNVVSDAVVESDAPLLIAGSMTGARIMEPTVGAVPVAAAFVSGTAQADGPFGATQAGAPAARQGAAR